MPTMRDSARAASVSTGSVSNDFTYPALVAEDTRQAIPPATQQAGYHPNAAARSLKTSQSLRLGLAPLISLEDNCSLDPDDTTFLAFLSGTNTAAQEAPIYERPVGEHLVDVYAEFASLAGPDERLKRIPRQFISGKPRRTPSSKRIQNG
jgi:hypothetical protein